MNCCEKWNRAASLRTASPAGRRSGTSPSVLCSEASRPRPSGKSSPRVGWRALAYWGRGGRAIAQAGPQPASGGFSGHGGINAAVEAPRLGPFDFIEKPLETNRVMVTVRNAVDTRRLKTENRSYRRDAEKTYNSMAVAELATSMRIFVYGLLFFVGLVCLAVAYASIY